MICIASRINPHRINGWSGWASGLSGRLAWVRFKVWDTSARGYSKWPQIGQSVWYGPLEPSEEGASEARVTDEASKLKEYFAMATNSQPPTISGQEGSGLTKDQGLTMPQVTRKKKLMQKAYTTENPQRM